MTSRFALTVAAAAGLFVCACVSPNDLTAGEGGGGGGGAAAARKNPIPADGKSLAAGREVYTANCADCHGPRGKGDGRMAKDLKRPPPDLTQPEVANEADDVLFNRISRARKPMPSFEKLLTEEQRWHVVNYVHKLSAAK